ncbi:hypothetical protein GCM10010399_47280 [Dactylosporangium fulvum]|uniref:Septum formation family protein n=1 Tax=Dactylosporangium fulvum TaxID=53359 RepID=A0ABY5VM15_9ACTN|nr:septum formation family protein [Dactylosporangium fulvum]UWP78662.1 septum formation family protein [Dactylosporangium fulvum]
MVKRFALVTAALAAVLVTGACAAPDGADRDLVDDWVMLGEAKVPEPVGGDCWTTDLAQLDAVLASPSRVVQMPCDFQHAFETVHVGHFTGNLADGSTPPALEEMTAAYTECDDAAKSYLGAAWQAGRTHLLIVPPTKAQWAGGARFFRCDVGALRTEAGYLEPRKTTLKDSLKAGGELLLGCGTQVGVNADTWDDITPTACTAPHDVEFVGAVESKAQTYPADDKSYESAFADRCEQALLNYTGMTPSHFGKQRSLYFGYWMTAGQQEWKAGNRTARCYAMLDKKKISRSLKGAGNISI